VGSRERKRAERRKRKARGAERPHSEKPTTTRGPAAMTRGYARTEERNRAAREALEPLTEGERPTVVTIGAVVSTIAAAIFWVSTVLAIAGVEVDGDRPAIAPIVLLGLVLTALAYGMWRARYWAVLGFQTVLLIAILLSVGGLVLGPNPIQAIGNALLLLGAGVLFWFMVKAMARIQMPQRLPRE
jgi:hypothetical protein